MRMRYLLGWIAILAISLSPALLLFTLGPQDYSSWTHIVGQLAGLIGMTMFSLTFLLSTRWTFIEDIFGGLDKVYRVHAVLGACALVLLLMHPIFLVLKYIPDNIPLAAKYLLPGGLLSVDLGIIALGGMIALLFATLYMSIRYNYWKMSHRFLGLFFMFAVLHVFLVRGNVSRDFIFQGYYGYAAIVSALGVSGFVYSLVFRTWVRSYRYKVESVRRSKNVFELTLKPLGKPLQHRPGQFVFIRFHSSGLSREQHPFSIASKPGAEKLKVMVKILGDFTSKMDYVKAGDLVQVEGSYGRFYSKSDKDEVWIAAGIGVTPFLGMARDFSPGMTKKVRLFYTTRNEDDFVGIDHLEQLEKANRNFKIVKWVSSKQGHLTVDKLGPVKDKELYICGPGNFKEAFISGLVKAGVRRESIHDERFNFK